MGSAEGETRIAEGEMGRAQDMVEVTQKKILARQGCVCDSPRIEVGGRVFLYQGQSDGRPYYRSDIEGRSLPSPTLPTSSPRRNKRSAFIGRVDGGGTTTTRRPWNYGAHGGGSGAWSSSSSRSWSSSTSTGIGGSRLGVSSSRGTLGGSRVSASSIGSRLGPGLPPPPPSPQFLYWYESKCFSSDKSQVSDCFLCSGHQPQKLGSSLPTLALRSLKLNSPHSLA